MIHKASTNVFTKYKKKGFILHYLHARTIPPLPRVLK